MAPQAQAVTSAAPQYPAGGGSSTALEGFFGVPPIAQPASPAGSVHTPTVGSTTAIFANTTYDGGITGTAYTIGDIVAALKALGLIAI
jgi:hypothetical protein